MKHVLGIARQHLGLKEWPGARHNPEIIEMFDQSGHAWVQDDETPWCAAFVGAVLGQAGLRGTGKLNARSYLDWGEEIPLSQAQEGDIVVFWRGEPDGWQGHVGFYAGIAADGAIKVLGGNQGNAVSIADYPRGRLLSVRRATKPRSSQVQSTTQISAVGGQVGNALTALQVIPRLDGTAQILAIIGFTVVGLALAWVMRERARKWRQGDR